MTNKSWLGGCKVACAVLWLLQYTTSAAAQAPLQAALFKTAAEQSALSPLAAALDPVLAEQLGKAPQLTIVATPALDLPSLQLAVDCVGETPSCLAQAAEHAHAEAVLAPSLSRTGNEVVLSLLYYDPRRSAGSLRVVTRRVPRDAGDSAVLSAGSALVQELFGAPPLTAAEPPAPEPAPQPPPPEPEPSASLVHDSTLDPERPAPRSPSLVAPLTLGIAGVIGVGVGVAFGVAASSGEDAYAKQRVTTPADAARANDRYDSAARSALISNVSIGVGAAALMAAVVVWLVQRPSGRKDSLASASPRLVLAPGQLALTGDWR